MIRVAELLVKETCFMRMTQSRWTSRLSIVGLGLFAVLGIDRFAFAQKTPVVYVAPIEGIIDLGLAPFVQRVLNDATREGAAAVILEINTFGGRVDAAVLIRDALLNARVPTVAFVNKRAISAGALISLAAEKIVMANGGTIGAATPVQMGQPGAPAQPVEEKTVSYVRKGVSRHGRERASALRLSPRRWSTRTWRFLVSLKKASC